MSEGGYPRDALFFAVIPVIMSNSEEDASYLRKMHLTSSLLVTRFCFHYSHSINERNGDYNEK